MKRSASTLVSYSSSEEEDSDSTKESLQAPQTKKRHDAEMFLRLLHS